MDVDIDDVTICDDENASLLLQKWKIEITYLLR